MVFLLKYKHLNYKLFSGVDMLKKSLEYIYVIGIITIAIIFFAVIIGKFSNILNILLLAFTIIGILNMKRKEVHKIHTRKKPKK